MKIIRKLLSLIVLAMLLGTVFLAFNNKFFDFNSRVQEFENSLNDTISFADNISEEIITPPPLVGNKEFADSLLTKKGVLEWTNIQRNENGLLPPLIENEKLDIIAKERLDDMFQKQYFDHISPQGTNVSDVAKQNGYEFIVIGENLALGNFEDDQAIVQAWMDSPGHRENILNNRYEEIGISVGQGVYQGHKTWIGVQVFSLPLSACPKPSQKTKTSIETYKNKINDLESDAKNIKSEIEDMDPKNKEEIKMYNRKIDEYNGIINEINVNFSHLENLISEYNRQIDVFNSCVKGE